MRTISPNNWVLSSWVVSIFLILPVIAIAVQSLAVDTALFDHLWATVLTDYIINTVQLVFLVLVFSALFALPSAWFIAMCEFKGRKQFQWLLMLPLAMPAYVVAYIYTDLLDFAGPIQRAMRAVFQANTAVGEYWFFEVRNIYGAALMLSLVLYPYLYLIARTAFLEQGASLFQVSRTLGLSPWQSIKRISLPLCRPAIVVGLIFIGAEALGDFATVHYFAVNTLTTAVYDSWLGHGSLSAAAKISMLMLISVVGLLSLERWQRGKQQFYHKSSGQNLRLKLNTRWATIAFIWCLLLIAAGFFIPVVILIDYAIQYFSGWQASLWQVLLQSVWLALSVALITAIIAILFVYTQRLTATLSSAIPLRISTVSYIMPSTVLAIGILIPMTFFEISINDYLVALGFQPPGLFLSGTVFALMFAFAVRFQAVANGVVESSFLNVSPSLDMASRTLGKSYLYTLFFVHLPLIKKGIFTAVLLVFIECMKELPAALLLRPFNFDTLATYIYQYVSDEQLEQAAFAAILIVLAGLIPVIRLTQTDKLKSD
ncbi:MAG: iron ABC transporter permease [Gammaproteobacteria bacterium]|nr:MAG: iron ABC transporter permease [Gammaproteobacteria bacterium]